MTLPKSRQGCKFRSLYPVSSPNFWSEAPYSSALESLVREGFNRKYDMGLFCSFIKDKNAVLLILHSAHFCKNPGKILAEIPGVIWVEIGQKSRRVNFFVISSKISKSSWNDGDGCINFFISSASVNVISLCELGGQRLYNGYMRLFE